ncbi:MAG: hypothetical protein AB1757_24290 [Acidobacteriota bacterium]
MKTLKEYALAAWTKAQTKEQRAEFKKRKRQAQKIENALKKLLPKDSVSYQLEHNLEDQDFTVVVTATDASGSLKFTHNAEGELALVGKCPNTDKEVLSQAIESAADLGRLLEHFEPHNHSDCESV